MRHAILAAVTACFFIAPAALGQDGSAQNEFNVAFELLRNYHINRDKVNWEQLRPQAEALFTGDKAADAAPAIRFLITTLGEKHTFLLPRDAAAARLTGEQVGNATPPLMTLPRGKLVGSDIGVVELKGVSLPDAANAYAETARNVLAQLAAARICRVIVDLRGNTGGNMYPMMAGISRLLGPEPYGYFIGVGGQRSQWRVADMMARANTLGTAAMTQRNLNRGVQENLGSRIRAPGVGGGPSWQTRAPVAVLMDRRTASSGEMTALAFKGRANSRFFGENSAGFLTANGGVALPDGAMLAVTTAYVADRNLNQYDGNLTPDEATPPGDETVAAAVKWLRTQPCEAE